MASPTRWAMCQIHINGGFDNIKVVEGGKVNNFLTFNFNEWLDWVR